MEKFQKYEWHHGKIDVIAMVHDNQFLSLKAAITIAADDIVNIFFFLNYYFSEKIRPAISCESSV